ncbi:hypothetical protein V1514DRAFT_318997 [Lipomyces japonicus]|uniref:uncharacterized protein n=1 Tax=Lipomyces japonicus TaxID=56871 RepID=UPI0034CEC6F5
MSSSSIPRFDAGPHLSPDQVRRSNNRFMMAAGLTFIVGLGAYQYYQRNNKRPYSPSTMPKSHTRFSEYPTASSSNQKGINTTLSRSTREVPGGTSHRSV